MKKIIGALKRIMFSGFLIYGYNMLTVSYNMTIPMNVITVGTISVLGFPALFSFILIKKMIF